MIRARRLLVLATLGAICLGAASCSSDNAGSGTPIAHAGSSGSSSVTAGAGGTPAAGSGGSGPAGAPSAGASGAVSGGGSGGTTTSGAANGGNANGGTANGGASGAAMAGASGALGLGGGMHTMPTCAKPTPSPNAGRASECDYLLQSLDFDSLGYATTPDMIKTTAFGQAFGLSAINDCSPYCYQKNLTVGVDIVGGSQASTQGEIVVEFPASGGGLPIAAADADRNVLAWITFDGAAKPPFEIDTQLIIETQGNVVVASVENKAFFKTGGNTGPFGPFSMDSYGAGSEFKYFNAVGANGFPSAPKNVTGMGFRIVAKATAGQEWHGVAYIDHLQIRAGSPSNPPGPYPYGLN